ncbi:MAG: hypothetical protein D6820_05920, partial [Lentisphaerae bacterium]
MSAGICAVALFIVMPFIRAQELEPPPKIVKLATMLYPEAGPGTQLVYELDAASFDVGVRLTRYKLMKNGREIGKVVRIQHAITDPKVPGV